MLQNKKTTKEPMRPSVDLNDLLPCPFCGKKAIIYETYNDSDEWIIQCIECNVLLLPDDKESNIKLWNTRIS